MSNGQARLAVRTFKVNLIETLICVLLLLVAVPDLCGKLGRPAMANAFFVIGGVLLQPLVLPNVAGVIIGAGLLGFLLVLFEVGLEIDLPRFREFVRPLLFALAWAAAQFPVIFGLASAGGLSGKEGVFVWAAISGCSMSMAYPAWKRHAGLNGGARTFVLEIMVALEMLSIVLLAVGDSALRPHGLGWSVLLKLAGIAVTIFLIGRFASHLSRLFQQVIEKTTHWRVHFIVLLVLIICAVGERLGLAAAKSAFFLGLFMSRAEFQRMSIEDYIAPISRRFLIPIFFVSLGLRVEFSMLFSHIAWLALCGSILLLGFREMVHRRWLKTGGDDQTHLLMSPNLTMAALAATSLFALGHETAGIWVVLTGLFVSLLSLLLLPAAPKNADSETTEGRARAPVEMPERAA